MATSKRLFKLALNPWKGNCGVLWDFQLQSSSAVFRWKQFNRYITPVTPDFHERYLQCALHDLKVTATYVKQIKVTSVA